MMHEQAISVAKLVKQFTFPVKDPNKGFLQNLLSPRKKTVTAVDGISFSVPTGQTLAFIGPNGAGKSTTIKMLTGILYPTRGQVQVLGLDPQKERKQLALNIGTVFGQRSQLLFNLPMSDSFDLFAKVYEVPDATYRQQKKKLVELFDLGELLDQPVRKLSLGQRMRAEIAAALLHEPPIIFLDEPTIGLDVVAKRKLRENLTNINSEFATTIFLTSHDAGDIESICERTIIVNHGKIIYDGKTGDLKKQYLNKKIVTVLFSDAISNVSDLEKEGVMIKKQQKNETVLHVDTTIVPIEEVLKQVIHRKSIADITIEDPPLEEVISQIYHE